MRTWIGSGIRSALIVGIVGGCGSDGMVTEPGQADGVSAALALSALVSTTDPEGDASATQGNGLTGEAYQDIVSTEIDAEGGVFAFSMDVAANVPAAPVLPGGITVQEWSWNLSTGPALPRGFPFPTGSPAPPEFIVMVLWDGVTFNGILIDRRPLLSGGEAGRTSIPVEIDGTTISAIVHADLLDDPSSFAWVARTNDWPHLGSNSLQTLDRAPDIAPAFWP
jgi:hypothetical protein